ncbi:unnamed protein product, partial [Prorocentrum cordatum]
MFRKAVQPPRTTIYNLEWRINDMSGTIDIRFEEVEEQFDDTSIRATNLESNRAELIDDITARDAALESHPLHPDFADSAQQKSSRRYDDEEGMPG